MGFIIEDSIFSTKLHDNYIVIDLEATGNSSFSYITEISALKVKNGKIISEFNELVKPPEYRLVDYSNVSVSSYEIENNLKIFYVDSFIEKLTGITNNMIHKANTESDVIKRFYEFIGDDIIVGHGLGNDFTMINSAYNRVLERNFEHKFIDTFELALFVDNVEYSLINLCNRFEIENKSTHRARSDAFRTHLCYEKLKKYVKSNFNSKVYAKWIEDGIEKQRFNNLKHLVKKYNNNNWRNTKDYLLKFGNLEEILENKSIFISPIISEDEVEDIKSLLQGCDVRFDDKLYNRTDIIIIDEDVDIHELNSDSKEIMEILDISKKRVLNVITKDELYYIYDNGYDPNFFFDNRIDQYINFNENSFYIDPTVKDKNIPLIYKFISSKNASVSDVLDENIDYIIIGDEYENEHFFETVNGASYRILYSLGYGGTLINETRILKLIQREKTKNK